MREGEPVIFIDRKRRRYLKRLTANATLSIRGGKFSAGELIGQENGAKVRSSLNEPFVILRPTLEQLIPNLPRKAQVIYPKDIALMLMWGDVYPGITVIEAGVGPGALTLALLRALGAEGRLISYEIREDFARAAEKTVAAYFGAAPQWTLIVGDVSDGLAHHEADRIFLDLPEPWHQTHRAWDALRPGGVLVGYVPTVLQVKGFVDSLTDHGGFECIQTIEGLVRPWHVKELSVRPEHHMVAHTGFVISARRVVESLVRTRQRDHPATTAHDSSNEITQAREDD